MSAKSVAMTDPFPTSTDDALRDSLRGLHRQVLAEPLPASMQHAAERMTALQGQTRRIQRWTAVTASVLLSFGMGWVMHGQVAQSGSYAMATASGAAQHEFVRQAGFAHAVYQPEKRHPVEVAAAEQEHLVQWLSKRVGKPLKVPNLSAQGYELVGGRLLPGDTGARAQFMFQNSQGQRVTLYLGLVEKQPQGADLRETRFHYEAGGAKGESPASFYWFDQGFGYALSGQLSRDSLMALADATYAQLWPEAKKP